MSENRLQKISALENKIQTLDTERASLVQELNQLKKLSNSNSSAPVTQYSPSADKIKLFKSVFRGREDVYPKRWGNTKTGKSGYSPVCGNEWKAVCEKPRVSGESLFCESLFWGIPAQASGKNLTRPFMPSAPQPSCVRATSPHPS